MAWIQRAYGCAAVLAALTWAGCSDDADDGSTRAPDGATDDREPQSNSGSADAGVVRDGGTSAPEQEVALSFDAPRAGARMLYVPNPITNRVAVVDANTYAIESLAVGSQPTYAATVPGQDVALVLNVGSRDAALLRSEQGVTRVRRLEIGHDANAIAIAPGGLHAVVYPSRDVPGSTAQSFQDVTVVALTPGAESARRVSVGFRPSGVQFSADGRRAFVVTEDGVSIIDFSEVASGPTIARLVRLGDTLAAQSVDVQVTPDGQYALARREGESTLRLVTLADGRTETLALASVALPAPPGDAPADAPPELTDLDIGGDGSFAVAVVRNRGALVRIPIPGGFRDPSSVAVRAVREQPIGSVTLAARSPRAIAYTTVGAVEGVILLDDVSSDAPARSVVLRKAVHAVALSDDGTRALVLHAPVGSAGPGASDDARIDVAEGYSVIDTTTSFVKLQLTSARVEPRDILITPERTRLFALLRDDARGVRGLDMVDLASFQITSTPLAKPPTSIGFLPGLSRVFVGQAAEGGLITFLDQSGARLRDVSGFEIASRIRQ